MPPKRILYGREIIPHHMLSYVEQVYDILVGEIEQGRWKVDDRLPGVNFLAKELGLGTKTIQSTYDRLKQDGYVRSLGYRGTFLRAQYPLSSGTSGTMGVLIHADQQGDPLILWYEHVILQLARRKGLVTDVRVLPPELELSQVNRAGCLFGPDTWGIIALTPFRMPVRFGDVEGALPLVFLCPPYERCVPKVCADVRDAYYDLTARFIRSGHRHILFSQDGVEPDPRQTQLHREGYLEAMQDHGLPVDQALLEASLAVDNRDLASVAAHLKALARKGRKDRMTAVVAGSLGRGMALARMAPLQQIDIPGDLSVAAIGSDYLDREAGRQLTGMLPDFDRMVEQCFALLEQQRPAGRADFTEVRVRMHFVPGHTLRPLASPARADLAPPPGVVLADRVADYT